jgi:hypothetical protein
MLGNQSRACNVVTMLPAASRSAGAANGSYVDLSAYIGDAVFICDIGAVTGNVVIKVEDATSGAGAGLADVTGAVSGTITTADTAVKFVLPVDKLRQFVRVTATVTTGPVLCGVIFMGNPRYSP